MRAMERRRGGRGGQGEGGEGRERGSGGQWRGIVTWC